MAFVTSRDGDYSIYGMRDDGSGQSRLSDDAPEDTNSPGAVFYQVEPDWSPDGSKIVFTSRRDGRSHVYVMRADGSGTRRLTSGKHSDASPSWSPDGRLIAFTRDGALYVMTPDGGDPRPATKELGGEDSDPAWSPDGRWLAYVRREPAFSTREIWRIRADGGDRHRITWLNAASYGPAWSRDGREIVFSSNAREDRYQLYEIGPSGKGLRRLTFQPGNYFDPSWSPDGKRLVFERDGLIYVRDTSGVETAITNGPNDGNPVWRPVQPASNDY
jgi:Tol biopolymer transport system component